MKFSPLCFTSLVSIINHGHFTNSFSNNNHKLSTISNNNNPPSHTTNFQQPPFIPNHHQNKRKTSVTLHETTTSSPSSSSSPKSSYCRLSYGEESRKFRRTIFTHTDWVAHRSSDRIIPTLRSMLFSGVVRQLIKEVSLVIDSAIFLVIWNALPILLGNDDGTTTTIWNSLPHLSLPDLPFTLSTPALGLLLVFRTDASYARWSEASTTWEQIVTQCRNIVRMATTFTDLSTKEGQASVDRLSRATWVFCRSLMNQLSGPEDDDIYEEQLREAFSKEKDPTLFVNRMLQAPDKTLASMAELSLVVDSVPIDEMKRFEIDKSLVILGDCIGSCERIYSTPVPLVYTRHAERFLSVWMLLLPASLYDTFVGDQYPHSGELETLTSVVLHGVTFIAAVALVALFLFGIEELAVQLEEPFGILPMQEFCDDVRDTAKGLRDWCVRSNEMLVEEDG